MSLLPEFILQTTIVRGIQAFRKDHRFIDQLFRNLDQNSIQQMRTFLDTQAIDLAINYPRSTLKVPAIVILLKSETESQAYLGDSMGLSQPEEFSYDGGIDDQLLGGVASVTSLSGEGQAVFGPITALNGTNNTIKIDHSGFDIDQFVGHNYTLRIVGGKGQGQIRKITANSVDTVMITPNWLTIPDNTSIFEVRSDPDEVLGEPSKLYDKRNGSRFIERRGSLYNVNYQVQVIGSNSESTIFLYAILKAIFTLSRTFMEKHGIINLKMSGTDFLPRAEYAPDFAYMRALNMDFLIPFDVFEDIDPMVNAINLVLEAVPPISIELGLDSAHPVIAPGS